MKTARMVFPSKRFDDKTLRSIFNSRKGTRVYIPMMNGTEQVWELVKINKCA